MLFIYLAFCSVIPWGLEPQSKEPESFILSIELHEHMRAKYISTQPCLFTFHALICFVLFTSITIISSIGTSITAASTTRLLSKLFIVGSWK